jgi:hypothetical protein
MAVRFKKLIAINYQTEIWGDYCVRINTPPPSRAELVSASHTLSRRAIGRPEICGLSTGYLYDGVPKQVYNDFFFWGWIENKKATGFAMASNGYIRFDNPVLTGLSNPGGLPQIGFQYFTSRGMTQSLQRLVFDLPYALAGEVEFFTYFFQRKRVVGA